MLKCYFFLENEMERNELDLLIFFRQKYLEIRATIEGVGGFSSITSSVIFICVSHFGFHSF